MRLFFGVGNWLLVFLTKTGDRVALTNFDVNSVQSADSLPLASMV